MWWWVISSVNGFYSFWSVANNSVDKLQLLILIAVSSSNNVFTKRQKFTKFSKRSALFSLLMLTNFKIKAEVLIQTKTFTIWVSCVIFFYLST